MAATVATYCPPVWQNISNLSQLEVFSGQNGHPVQNNFYLLSFNSLKKVEEDEAATAQAQVKRGPGRPRKSDLPPPPAGSRGSGGPRGRGRPRGSTSSPRGTPKR